MAWKCFIKRLKRQPLILLIPFLFFSCDFFDNDLTSFMNYYTQSTIDASLTALEECPRAQDGSISIPSGEDFQLVFSNPQRYTFDTKIVLTGSGVQGTAEEGFSIEPSGDKQLLYVTIKSAFLKKNERGGGTFRLP